MCGGSGGFPSSKYQAGKVDVGSSGGGGCIRSNIRLYNITSAFITIGGSGKYGTIVPGGYNGGGSTKSNTAFENGSGGGSTDLRFLENDVFHRVLIAGGGGGSDDISSQIYNNDGRGGYGGGEISQGFWIDSIYYDVHLANQTYGFSFSQGEGGSQVGSHHPDSTFDNTNSGSESAGAGGGWFGGFCSHHFNGGCGGGSSFALQSGKIIPEGEIIHHDEYYNELERGSYAFLHSEYNFLNVHHFPGSWYGNGFTQITQIIPPMTCYRSQNDVFIASFILFTHLFIYFS